MKKMISIILVLSTLFLFSCANRQYYELNNEENNGSVVNDDKHPDSRIVIYYQDCEGYRSPGMEAVSAYLERENATFKTASTLIFDMRSARAQVVVDKSSATPNTVNLVLFGKEYEMEHKVAYRTTLSASEKENVKKLAFYEFYRNEEASVEYRTQTSDILYFTKHDISTDYTPEDVLNEDELVGTAYKLLCETYGEEYIKEYDLESCTLSNDHDFYYVRFARYIHGYRSGDFIKVSIYSDGLIKGWSFKHKGIYDEIESSVTKETIDKAYEYMKATIEDDRLALIEDLTKVVVNYDGGYYLQVCASVKDKPYAELYYYVNLNQFQ